MLIEGPVGQLEVLLAPAEISSGITAVLCHPHPQYGGSLRDAVITTTAGSLLARGVDCVMFNFRGVGDSEGSFDEGNGEVDDVLAVANWVKEQRPDHVLWLMGYSFGSAMVWKALNTLTPACTILVAPPVGTMPFDAIDPTPQNVLAIAGDNDNFVDAQALRDWSAVHATLVEGADHFFSAGHQPYTQALEAALDTLS